MPVVKTVVYNKSGASKHFGFLPPFGKTIDNNATYTFDGDIYALLTKHKRHLTALANALTNNHIEVDVVYNEWRAFEAKVVDYTLVNDKDNGKHFTTRGLTGLASATITNVARTSNVVTITTSAAHGYVVGEFVTVAAGTATGVNGRFAIATVPSTTTFTYAQTGGDITSAVDTGTVVPGVFFTLPATIKAGQSWRFTNEADGDLRLVGPSGKLVTLNDLAANTVTLSTSGEKVGGSFEVVVNDDASKYLVFPHLYEAQTLTIAT